VTPAVRAPAHTAAPAGTWRLGLPGDRAVLVHRRPALVALALAAVLVGTLAVCLGIGSTVIDPLRALRGLLGLGPARDVLLVRELRFPRIEAAAGVGAALGLAGVLMQTLARNRLATPDTVGLNNGATAFAVASVIGVATSALPSVMALTGATTAAVLALALGGGAGRQGYRFLVVGLGIGAVFGAVTNLMLSRSAIDAAGAAYPWTVGSLSIATPTAVTLLELGLVLCLPAAVLLGRALALLRFPDAVALGLGSRVRAVRTAVLVTSVVCAGLAVAVAGPLGMVALVAPEAARKLSGSAGVPVVSSALAGAVLTLLADLVGRAVFAPIELPAGLVTAIVGGPYLLWLLLTTRTRRLP
jgi:iron complex transport system permease protein